MILSETKDPANAELIKKLKPVWGVGAEGEINGLGAWGYWAYLVFGRVEFMRVEIIKRREWQACVRRCQRLALSAGTVL